MRGYSHKGALSFIRPDWTALLDAVYLAVLFIFLSISMFPARALAFSNEVELSHLTLVFVRDPALAGVAMVGIEVWPKERTVAGLLKSPSLTVRSNLAESGVVRVLSTAYSSTIDQTDASPFTTASGRRVGPGTIAVNFLPFGTKVRIGNTTYTVWDRMNARYDDKYVVDIWQPTRIQALSWGARIVEMEVVALP